MKKLIFVLLSSLVLLIGMGGVIFQNKIVGFISYNLEDTKLLNEELQPAYYFTEEDFPYGNQLIHMRKRGLSTEVVIQINREIPIDEVLVARSFGTGSMFPTIPRKAFLIMVPINESELVVGDIVSIHQEDYNIIHRIIDISDGNYKTKGDNNKIADPEVWEIEDLDKKCVGVLW